MSGFAANSGGYALGWHDPIEYVFAADKGLNEGIIREISAQKEESPEILERRLTALGAGLCAFLHSVETAAVNEQLVGFPDSDAHAHRLRPIIL